MGNKGDYNKMCDILQFPTGQVKTVGISQWLASVRKRGRKS